MQVLFMMSESWLKNWVGEMADVAKRPVAGSKYGGFLRWWALPARGILREFAPSYFSIVFRILINALLHH